jgi:2-polyprenyl-6-methoxyphenol hydroxylase-like FAD-dependent oxidoreductase
VVSGGLISILGPDLELAIREVLPPEVDLRYGRTVSAVGQSREGVTETLDGADGIHSTIRELAFGREEDSLVTARNSPVLGAGAS